MKPQPGFARRNGLSIVFMILMVVSLTGQIYTGWREHNDFLEEHHTKEIGLADYLKSGHFIQATFENWESEFFQMALYVVLTIFLFQQGSSESNPIDQPDEKKEDELSARPWSSWPVKKGGFVLFIYKHSLSISLFLLFIVSFFLHWYGSWLDYNEDQLLKEGLTEEFIPYLGHNKFWFESFQNWQSEFLSVFAIIFLSIYLRQQGSSQSKPVNASNDDTGE